MDVTPHELRDVEITDAFRGYNRDEVNELLERAAAPIESQSEQIRILTERIDSATADVGRTRDNDDLLQRTLVLAQRVADEAVAEAQQQAATTAAEAQQQASTTLADAEARAHAAILDAETRSQLLLTEADARSQAMIAEATAEVRRVNEVERVRIEREIAQLMAQRDTLAAETDALERFEADLRTSLVDRLESDLGRLRDKLAHPVTPRPELSEISLAAPSVLAPAPVAPTAPVLPTPVPMPETAMPETSMPETSMPDTTGATAAVRDDDTIDLQVAEAAAPMPLVVSEEPAAAVTPLVAEPVEAVPAAAVPERQSYLEQVLSSTPPRRPEEVRAAEAERANLDDDEFFATLRDAVRSDAPLGPADEADDDDGRGLFRRRR